MNGWTPYPWPAIERVSRDAIRAQRQAREAIEAVSGRRGFARALTEALGVPVRFLSVRLKAAVHPVSRASAARCALQSADGTTLVCIEVEAELAVRLAALLLRRPPVVVDPRADVPESIQGAVAALALAVARRISLEDRLVLRGIGATTQEVVAAMGPKAFGVEATLLVGDDAYVVFAAVQARARPTSIGRRFDLQALRCLGEVALSLQIVAAIAHLERSGAHSLRVGDVLLPGQDWRVTRSDRGLEGQVSLCAASGTLGIPANLLSDGKIVVVGGAMNVEVDCEAPVQDVNDTTADVLADAPVVVRVELGQVSMTAREWASLRPGDVIPTGRRVAERAVLRISGREVANGELVSLDGELGVRIHELTGQPNGGAF